MKARWLLLASAALLTPITSVNAAEGRLPNGGAFKGVHAWTDQGDLKELARFPLRSTNPAYIVYVESLHPDPACTQDQQWQGLCSRTLCEIYVQVRPDLQPVRSEPVQADPSRVLIAQHSMDMREGNGTHMLAISNAPYPIVGAGSDGPSLVFHGPILLDYADGNQQCMADVKVEYAINFRNLANKWRP